MVASKTLTALDPAERRADVVLLCLGDGGRPVYGVLVEVQFGDDPDKPYRWPADAPRPSARPRRVATPCAGGPAASRPPSPPPARAHFARGTRPVGTPGRAPSWAPGLIVLVAARGPGRLGQGARPFAQPP